MSYFRLIMLFQFIFWNVLSGNETIYRFFEKHAECQQGEQIFLEYPLEQKVDERRLTIESIRYWSKIFGFQIIESRPEARFHSENHQPIRVLKIKFKKQN